MHHRPLKPTISRWIQFESNSRVFCIPINHAAGRPLRELGVVNAGEDQLQGHFRAGTPCSVTHLVWYVTQGSVHCEDGQSSRLAQAGDVILCPAQLPHYIETASKQAAGLWFHLSDISQWKHLHNTKATIRPANDMNTLKRLMEGFETESLSSTPLSESMSLHYAELISLTLRRELLLNSEPAYGAIHQRLNALWKDVEFKPEYEWTTECLAERVNVSSSYLYKLIATHFGCSPMKMVLRLRMKRAEALLLHTDLAIDAIASEVGYQTAYAFSNAYLKHTNQRPGAFRSKARKKLLQAKNNDS
ncbi:AraC family transcriptional regulator [Coraliomargarita algicola]|uniref:AraC family transcriptional regulator n=1 Tax=Coraliomargarita algicola TaxID=3092156 RepID=A0ABZ0RKV9_9BACT|nr:AraC family transcriptional regulator [Coraliomargarita sp. J2-16]WPJ95557.1 AraC family transcriptional regulator [Coraliomargarita sp. J2-16]